MENEQGNSWLTLLAGQSTQPKSVMDDMTQPEREAFSKWISEQPGDPERGGAINDMRWPGWAGVMEHRARERSGKSAGNVRQKGHATMSDKTEAKAKIAAAEKGCDRVQTAWNAAHEELAGGVSMNGCGIYHDQGYQLRRKLLAAQEQIKIALAELDAIDWPADADYDHF